MTLIDTKRALRADMAARRQSLGESMRRAAAASLRDLFFLEAPIRLPAVVSGFWPIRDEIDVRPLMDALVDAGAQLVLPVVQGRGQRLLFRAWRRASRWRRACSVPCSRRFVGNPRTDALLVPMLACDGEGWRLGYGGGFYDRTLADLRSRRSVTAIGVGFDLQLVPEVPHGADDQRLDWLLTDRRACAFV